MFTDEDLKRIRAHGMTPESVLAQLELFRKGSFPVRLNRPCTVNDGIRTLSEEESQDFIGVYEGDVRRGRILKFVPASGAASRMFQDWCLSCQMGGFPSREASERFVSDLGRFAFYEDLTAALSKDGLDLNALVSEGKLDVVLAYILKPRGLNYASLPKALLKFHAYPDRSRTSLEEHLVEASLYARDGGNVCRIHFTVSEEHAFLVNDFVSRTQGYYESLLGVRFDIGISTQKPSTHMVAADMENRPLRDPSGAIAFRPGGHGSLLENLNALDGAVIMMKNIDNVVPDRLKERTVFFKKVLGGYLIRLQDDCYECLRGLFSPSWNVDNIARAVSFCVRELNAVFHSGFDDLPQDEKRTLIIERLNRPIRVCGMVKNKGEPGGGPFWVNEEDGSQSLQIIEEAQVDQKSESQRRVWRSSTHFNPVDLACGIRNFKGEKFDLRNFVDEKTYLITLKSQDGMDMKALELPGLWNGSMARWNTVFVDVPIETFNPVKTVYDLLRQQHRSA